MPEIFQLLLGAAAGALSSFITMKLTLKNEIKKMGIQFNRADNLALRNAFSEMRATAHAVANVSTNLNKNKAQAALSTFMSLAPTQFFPLTEKLSKQILSEHSQQIRNTLQELDTLWLNYLESLATKR